MQAKKPVKITITIGTDMADNIIQSFLRNTRKPEFNYHIHEDLSRKIGRQVVRKFPELVAARNERVKADVLEHELKTTKFDVITQNQAIFDKYKPLENAALAKANEISKQAQQYYIENEKLRRQAVAESDALFNAEFKKAGIIHWQYKNGWITYVEVSDEKATP